MSRRIFVGSGKAQIELSGGLRDAVDRVLQGTPKVVADRLEEEARKLYEQAKAQWPEKTGKSKDALEYGLRIPDPSHIEAYVGFDPSKAPYVFYIHEKWPNAKRFVWQELLRKPARKLSKKVAAELGEELRRAAGRK